MFIANPSLDSATLSKDQSARHGSADSARARLIHDVRVALRRSGHAELRGVEIDADDSRVVISGTVPTFYLKQLSQEVARLAAPGMEVVNELRVRKVSLTR